MTILDYSIEERAGGIFVVLALVEDEDGNVTWDFLTACESLEEAEYTVIVSKEDESVAAYEEYFQKRLGFDL